MICRDPEQKLGANDEKNPHATVNTGAKSKGMMGKIGKIFGPRERSQDLENQFDHANEKEHSIHSIHNEKHTPQQHTDAHKHSARAH